MKLGAIRIRENFHNCSEFSRAGREEKTNVCSSHPCGKRSVNDLEEKLISMESKIGSRPADTGNGIRDEGRTKP